MKSHTTQVYSSGKQIQKTEQLAWNLAAVAAERAPILPRVAETAIDRIIDNASVAVAAINRGPVVTARSQALAHPRGRGATVLGLPNGKGFHAEWATWANTTAVRDLDMNDTFLAADYSHPSDNIPALVAVAQQCGKNGADLVRAIVVAYEIHIALAKAICLHEYRKDHVAHLGPATAAGLGALLNLDIDVIYNAIQHMAHVSFATRQSRRGAISSWKAFAPAHVAKLAVEAVDHALRGESAPSPIYEGEDGIIAAMLGGPEAVYTIKLPEIGEPLIGILESYPKAHSAEYQAQALIDLAIKVRKRIPDLECVETIKLHTSRHTHTVIGSGSGDPQKYNPGASRETLDHSAMYIFAVALEDGEWHHVRSYIPERSQRPSTLRLWRNIATEEDPEWTHRYNEPDPTRRSFGARVEIHLRGGQFLKDELAVANAHPSGNRPFRRNDFEQKYLMLTEGIVADAERERFLNLAQRLPDLDATEIGAFNLQVSEEMLKKLPANKAGIF